MAHGFALALVLVRLRCDGTSMLEAAALVSRETRVQTSIWRGSCGKKNQNKVIGHDILGQGGLPCPCKWLKEEGSF